MNFNKITEEDSLHQNLDLLDTIDLLHGINNEDQKVAKAVQLIIPNIEKFINSAYINMQKGGRLFYIGAGTSGRLGIVDASECPPTFGVDHDLVVGLIAGGDSAIRKAVEFAEDDSDQGWLDLEKHNIDHNDTVVGIAASGTTPYVVGTLKQCNSNQILTAGITCNPGSPLAIEAQHAIVPIVGPELVTGSTRMKSGTAQKLVLNMISTSLMIKLGRVKGNKMVDMQLSNNKLVNRGEKMIMETLHVNQQEAKDLLKKYGSVRKAIQSKD